MSGLEISVIAITSLNILLNIFFCITEKKGRDIRLNAIAGWFCALLWSLKEIN